MAIRIIKEVNRSVGASVLSGTIAGGTALAWDPANTGKLLPVGTGASGGCYGLACESNVIPPIAPSTGLTAGQGYDYTNFNRDGLLSVFMNGGEFEVYDDGLGAGSPIEAVTFAINGPVYADITTASIAKNLTSTVGSNILIGTVTYFDQAASPTILRFKLLV